MINKQGTQNNTIFLDLKKKQQYPKWQYNQNLLNENCACVPATAGGLIHLLIFSHL